MPYTSDAPWSAAFISYVVKAAGVNFPAKSAHTQYAQEIRKNPNKYPFFVIDPGFVKIERGDIVVGNRTDFDTGIRNNMRFTTAVWSGVSHGDVVVSSTQVIGGNLSDRVLNKTIKPLDLFVILRPKNKDDAKKIAAAAEKQFSDWEVNRWTNERQEGARQRVNQYWKAVGLDWIPPLPSFNNAMPAQSTLNEPNTYSGISPYIASLESFHPNIQYELTRRRIAANTADVYMPFVKLTSLVNVLGDNIPGAAKDVQAAWCPSLGPHGRNTHTFNETYLAVSNRSRIGYAIEKVPGKKFGMVPVIVDESVAGTEPENIPMPGIVEVTAERGTSGPMGVRGGLTKTELKIIAYSVGQVDTLLRYFLRPATRVVLEWGRNSATQYQPITPFNWERDAGEIASEFEELIKDPKKQTKFIEDYIYKNFGNYEILIGYVVKFNLSVNKNNVYEISLTVHSVQQFEIPNRHTSVKSLCSDATSNCAAMDIHEYFDDAYSWKEKTFTKLMTQETNRIKSAITSKNFYQWNGHIISVTKNEPNTTPSPANSAEAGTKQTDYFVSWQFFVDKILNDSELGILGLIDNTNKTQDFIQNGLLRPTGDTVEFASEETCVTSGSVINSLVANEVGYHPDLRSTNPEVMIIYNKTAQDRRTSTDKTDYRRVVNLAVPVSDGTNTNEVTQESFYSNNRIENDIMQSKVGSFKNINGTSTSGIGNLFHGVWLNSKAIKQAFTTTDTVSAAIESLLTMMNAATEGYWNLQLYSSERPTPGMFIIDYGLSKPLVKTTDGDQKYPWIDKEENEANNILNSINKINVDRYRQSKTEECKRNKPKYIYMFNRKTKILTDGTGELGSDILDLKVEFNLPQVIAVQAIAGVGGPAQKSTLQSLDIPQLNRISLINNIFPPCLTDTGSNNNPNFICPDNSPCQDENLNAIESRAKQLELKSGLGTSFAADATRVGPVGRSSTTSRQEVTSAIAGLNMARVERSYGNLAVVDKIRELSTLGTSLDLIEFNPAKMMKKLNINSRSAENGYANNKVHAFNSSNLTKTIASVTLPGIGGIELFQSFLIDRVPSILERGFYIVTKVTHKFSSSNGWLTTIEGRFRFRPEDTPVQGEIPDCYGIISGDTGAGVAQPTAPRTVEIPEFERFGGGGGFAGGGSDGRF